MTKPKDPYIDPIELTRAVFYDPETGVFTRNHAAPRSPFGAVLGRVTDKGYLAFDVLGHASLRAHRLAWYYCYGRWPNGQIDHVNGNPADNRIANLREVEEWVNHVNFHRRRPNKLNALGVQRHKASYRGVVQRQGKIYKTKSFKTVEEAAAARFELAKQIHGEYARR